MLYIFFKTSLLKPYQDHLSTLHAAITKEKSRLPVISEDFDQWSLDVRENFLDKNLPNENKFIQTLYKTVTQSIDEEIKEMKSWNQTKQRGECNSLFKDIYLKFEECFEEYVTNGEYDKSFETLLPSLKWEKEKRIDNKLWETEKEKFNVLIVSFFENKRQCTTAIKIVS